MYVVHMITPGANWGAYGDLKYPPGPAGALMGLLSLSYRGQGETMQDHFNTNFKA